MINITQVFVLHNFIAPHKIFTTNSAVRTIYKKYINRIKSKFRPHISYNAVQT